MFGSALSHALPFGSSVTHAVRLGRLELLPSLAKKTTYAVTVNTSSSRGSGTDANVYITMYDATGAASAERKLVCGSGSAQSNPDHYLWFGFDVAACAP